MIYRKAWLACAFLIASASACQADVFRWDNDQLIPGTEGITPGPGVQLNDRALEFANLQSKNLTGANFGQSNLTNAWFMSSTLTNADLAGANLSRAGLSFTTLANADLTGAIVTGASFDVTTSRGFTKEQLYSTASYQAKHLQGISLESNDLNGWDFSGQDLTNAELVDATLTNANLTGAKLTGSVFWFTNLTNANLTGAFVNGADFGTSGLTKEQLYSTASYQAKDLRGIGLGAGWSPYGVDGNNLTGWDFSGQNLTGANFHTAILTNADLTNSVVQGANFGSATHFGFAKEQLYSTASYQVKDLSGVNLANNDLTGWDLRGHNLSDAIFYESTLTNTDLAGAVVAGVDFGSTTSRGFTRHQLYSTASYQAKDLRGVDLESNNLTGWDFSGQDLTGANFALSTLTNADLAGAFIAGVDFGFTTSRGFTQEMLYSTASYQAKDLHGIRLSGCCPGDNLNGWDFSWQNLTGAVFHSAVLSGANFRGANLTNVTFELARLANADLTGADTRGAQELRLTGTVSRNAILPDGKITGLDLAAGESMHVRDDDPLLARPHRGFVPPRPSIPVSIHERLQMADGSVLRLLIDADQWDSLISFAPGIPVQLGGALELTFADEVDVAAQVGRTLDLFDWTGVSPSGQFEIRSPYVWNVANLYATGEVTLIAVPEPSTASIMFIGITAFVACRRRTILRLPH
jgi:uncharacterized protein YjbI with pentapeptide repeats